MSGAEQTSKEDMDYFQGGNYRHGEKMSLMTSSSFCHGWKFSYSEPHSASKFHCIIDLIPFGKQDLVWGSPT